MIIDAHTHIFPSEIRTGRDKYARPGEMTYSAIYRQPSARMIGAEELIAVMDEDGVDRAVTFGFPWATEETAKAHNDYILESQARFPGRLIGLACFDPRQPWAGREAERCLDAGLHGLGELAVYEAGFDQETIGRLSELGRLCRERGLPLLVHASEPVGHQYPGKAPLTLKMIYDLVLALKGTRLILAHWGGGLFFYGLMKREVPEALAEVYFDTAASPFLYRPEIYALAARVVGPEKILFGSDYPLIKPGRYFREMEAAGLDETALKMIKGGTAARVFEPAKLS
ncbi:MAG: amidohydrolase family protein [Thermodesulfobacteriota bacterium]